MKTKITSWAIIFLMVFNTFGILLPLEARAANLEKQEASQVAEMEKLQKEAKEAQYKELGLTKTEIAFVEKYSDKLESFYQYTDTYVSYDPTSGLATLDIAKFNKYSNFLQTARVLGLSFAETNTLRRIVLKNIKNYNGQVSAIKDGIDANGNKTTKKIVERGVEVVTEVSISPSIQTQSARVETGNAVASFGCGQYVYWSNAALMWYGYGVSISFTDCAVQGLATLSGSISAATGFISKLCIAGVITASVCGLPLGIISTGIAVLSTTVKSANWACGNKGLIFKDKIYWSGVSIFYWQCP